MMRFVLICFLMSVSLHASAANILWGKVCVNEGDYQSICIEKSESSPFFFTGYTVGVSVERGIATLTSNPDGRLLIPGGGWLEAMAGELVDARSMLNQLSYFENGHIDDLLSGQTEHSISVGVNAENYLKFIIHDSEQEFAYYDGTRTDIPDCYYGWAKYKVNDNGSISILSSAINLDGGSILVGSGAIPEPTSGMLVLIGVACLSLKRRSS